MARCVHPFPPSACNVDNCGYRVTVPGTVSGHAAVTSLAVLRPDGQVPARPNALCFACPSSRRWTSCKRRLSSLQACRPGEPPRRIA